MATSRRSTPSARKRLGTYREKRDFSRTTEPAPDVAAPRGRASSVFVVHKHDATRLHYDLRLEIDGVLVSWAIPKGPSYDPADKRLAVQTEDHPLAYATYEGRIPEGAYGAGDSLLWESGTFDTVPPGEAREQLARGRLHVALHGEKLEGEWHLIRTRTVGKKAQWLCFKAKDGTERSGYDVTLERPESVKSGQRVTRGPTRRTRRAASAPTPVRASRPARRKPSARSPGALLDRVGSPMLATLSQVESAEGAGWCFEVKYDGFRALAARQGGHGALRSRNGNDLSARFPALLAALDALGDHEAVVDGEIIALDAKGRSRFQLLGKGAEERYVLFDLLWLDGEDLRALPLKDRRARLERLLKRVKPPLALAERVEEDARRALASAKRRGLEGVIAKREDGPYTEGRGAAWLKLKAQASQEVAIVGYTPMANERPEVGSLLVAVREGAAWRYAGKVGTGYTAPVRRELLERLSRERVKTPVVEDAPRVRDALRHEEAVWVKPRHVAQVTFTEWTADGRLRHPSFQGLRTDKRPEECVRERPGRASRRPLPASPSPASRGPHRRQGTKKRQASRAAGRSAAARTRKASPEVDAELATLTALTHGDRVLFPGPGFTKADVQAYYRDVAPLMVPALEGRPLALQQWPQGIEAPGFFRQEVPGRARGAHHRARAPPGPPHVPRGGGPARVPALARQSVRAHPAHVVQPAAPSQTAGLGRLRPGSGAGGDVGRSHPPGPGAAPPPRAPGIDERAQDVRQARAARARSPGSRAYLRADPCLRPAHLRGAGRGAPGPGHHRALQVPARGPHVPGRGPERLGQDGGGALFAPGPAPGARVHAPGLVRGDAAAGSLALHPGHRAPAPGQGGRSLRPHSGGRPVPPQAVGPPWATPGRNG